MLIEDLIRVGRPLLAGGMRAKEILQIISDVRDERVKNFYRHVFVAELPPPGERGRPVALPVQVWGQESVQGKQKDFTVDLTRALSAPFVYPTGGNPLNPQGSYGVPVYPAWLVRQDKKTGAWRSFCEREEVYRFLRGRIERTPSLRLNEATLHQLAEVLADEIRRSGVPEAEKTLGIIVLVQPNGAQSAYTYADHPTEDSLGPSLLYPGRHIVANYDALLEQAWQGKVAEGAEIGEKQGLCSVCGSEGRVIAPYCKSWPWALPEWNCPLPHAGKETHWIEGVALCEHCSRALTLGARVFGQMVRPLHAEVTRELFSPVADAEGRRLQRRGDLQRLTIINGSGFLLPLSDTFLADPALAAAYSHNLASMLARPKKEGPFAEQYMETVIGFDLFLPEEVDATEFRLTLVYFHGDYVRGDVHVRAIIQDVIPSTLRALRRIATKSCDRAWEAVLALLGEERARTRRQNYASVPYLLARGFGGPFLWDCLQTVLRRAPLDVSRPVRYAAARMNSLAHRLPDTSSLIKEEVAFFLTLLAFADEYNSWRKIETPEHSGYFESNTERRGNMSMRDWKELLAMLEQQPVASISFASPAELGFACGVFLRQFGRWYYNATGKDLLKHRVMTYGTDLTPELVWKRGLVKLFDVEARYPTIHVSNDFRQRVGVTLASFEQMEDQVKKDRDGFMSAFWAGYSLQGTLDQGGRP
ncbi:MAG: hypothetical protein ONB25_13015 [candidate division KSB1 bacterium]|nr:hypothetical protein [candidate division KSB1 bacterium]